MAFRMKGQGATEYLVLLAVVLIIAIVSIALLGFFPSLSTDARVTQSQSYWKAGRPIGIIDYTIATTGNATLVLQNFDTNSIKLTSIQFCTPSGTSCGNVYIAASGTSFGPGEVRNIVLSTGNVSQLQISPPTVGQVYEWRVAFNYTTSRGLQTVQNATSKTLVGKYI